MAAVVCSAVAFVTGRGIRNAGRDGVGLAVPACTRTRTGMRCRCRGRRRYDNRACREERKKEQKKKNKRLIDYESPDRDIRLGRYYDEVTLAPSPSRNE